MALACLRNLSGVSGILCSTLVCLESTQRAIWGNLYVPRQPRPHLGLKVLPVICLDNSFVFVVLSSLLDLERETRPWFSSSMNLPSHQLVFSPSVTQWHFPCAYRPCVFRLSPVISSWHSPSASPWDFSSAQIVLGFCSNIMSWFRTQPNPPTLSCQTSIILWWVNLVHQM